MTETEALRADASISGDDNDVRVGVRRSRSTSTHLPRRVPFFILRDQAYYWTQEWQEGEAEADAELRRDEARTFDDPEEALRWLDSPED